MLIISIILAIAAIANEIEGYRACRDASHSKRIAELRRARAAAADAVRELPARIAVLEASAARLTACNLLVSADYDLQRAAKLRARLAIALEA